MTGSTDFSFVAFFVHSSQNCYDSAASLRHFPLGKSFMKETQRQVLYCLS